MGLYHFTWRGKERTVAIETHSRKKVLLRFLDEEVLEALEHKPIEITAGSSNDYLKMLDSTQQVELIKAVEQAVGDISKTTF